MKKKILFLSIRLTHLHTHFCRRIIFEKKVLLEWALRAYELAQKENKSLNFDYQIALIHGQLGNIEIMADKLLQFSFEKQDNTSLVQNYLSRFIIEDLNGNFTAYLKKALLTKTQKESNDYWNQFLSWLYVQQKEYGKAFIQEKAIYKRNPENFYNIVTLARLAINNKQNDDATTILQFVIENTQDIGLQMQAHHFLLQMKIDNTNEIQFIGGSPDNNFSIVCETFMVSKSNLNIEERIK